MIVSKIIVNINAFMIKEFTEWDHGYVAEIFAETSCDKMSIYPTDILLIIRFRQKELRVLGEDDLECFVL
jgi:hypothetical protein